MEVLKLKPEELSTLKEVLEKDIAELRVEIRHTDNSECHEMLRHKEETLEKIFSALPVGKKS